MAADEQANTEQSASGQDTDETPAVDPNATRVGVPVVGSPEGEQSPADAQRAGEGRPQDPLSAAATAPAAGAAGDTPEGTGPGGSVRGGYGVGATGPGGGSDVRGPSS